MTLIVPTYRFTEQERKDWEEWPECRLCHYPLTLNEGCEWPEDDRALLCVSCLTRAFTALLNTPSHEQSVLQHNFTLTHSPATYTVRFIFGLARARKEIIVSVRAQGLGRNIIGAALLRVYFTLPKYQSDGGMAAVLELEENSNIYEYIDFGNRGIKWLEEVVLSAQIIHVDYE